MSLKEQIQADIKEAMKAKDELRKESLRLFWGELRKVEIDDRKDLNDAEVLKLLQKAIKQKDDSIEGFLKGGRDELVERERAEKEILSAYLPKQLSAEELEAAVAAVISELGAKDAKELGRVIKEATARIGGSSDGKSISETAKRLLGGA